MGKTLRFNIKRGLDIPISGEPEQTVHPAPTVHTIGLLGADHSGMQHRMLLDVGDRVRLGQAVWSDKHDPLRLVTAPGCGTINAINRGPKRRLKSVVIELDGDDEDVFDHWPRTQFGSLGCEEVGDRLLESGLWTAFRTRPYGHLADLKVEPSAIFVRAIESEPLAPDPGVVLDARREAFTDGVRLISKLTSGHVYVCSRSGSDLPVPDDDRILRAEFEGPHPSGLVGTHIHFLEGVDHRRLVWYLDYQDVIAIGLLFTTGRLFVERVIALSGPGMNRPRLVRSRQGAPIDQLTEDELIHQSCRLISGSCLSGRQVTGPMAYLGRHHDQICAIPEAQGDQSSAFALNQWLPQHSKPLAYSTAQHGKSRTLISTGTFEQVMPLDLLPTPLLKALLIRDLDRAVELGCLELEEPDLALCSFLCCSKQDYGAALRDCLDRFRAES